MSASLRLEVPRASDDCRWLVGVSVSPRCDRVSAALVCVRGTGLAAAVEVLGTQTRSIPHETTALFGALSNAVPCAVTSLASLRTQLTDHEATTIQELLASQGMASGRVLAVGVHDPGLWELHRGEAAGYLGLCDPARLAETTGLNVLDAFPARDLAVGGQGGPIGALAEWLLLGDPLRNRVLLDLGHTIRLSYLPTTRIERAVSRVLSFEVGPGFDLLDLLTQRLSGGQHRFDPGGRLAVQGKRIKELVDHWMHDSYFDCPPPRWHPHGVRPERFLADALTMAVAADWSVRDLLCTATHFIAEMIAQTLGRRLPEDAAIDEIIVTGGGQHNGLLLHEIGRLTALPLKRLDELSMPAIALGSASAALLAVLYLDQIPANPTSITNAATPRVLGRLTGGSPQSWQTLLQTCASGNSAFRPLRAAV